MLDRPLNDIRAAVAQISGLHANGTLTRADIDALVQIVADRTDEVEILVGVRPATVSLPVMTLADVVANARARGSARAGHLRLVPEGGAA